MLYICYYEMKPENLDKAISLFQEMVKLRGTGDYPKEISPTYGISTPLSGFTLYEVESQKQIDNHYIHYHPYVKFTWKPLLVATDFVATYMKKKKG